jgi:HAE1 family hydrophobic/amphiphilic exporter-1
VVSQALTLFTTPVVYLYLDRFSNLLSRWMARKPEVEEAHQERKDAAE